MTKVGLWVYLVTCFVAKATKNIRQKKVFLKLSNGKQVKKRKLFLCSRSRQNKNIFGSIVLKLKFSEYYLKVKDFSVPC